MSNNWKTYKLKEVADLMTGFAFKSKFYENEGKLKVIRGKNITEGYLRWGNDARFWNHSLDKLDKYKVDENDIVIGMDGSKIGKNRAIIRKHDLPAILAQRVAMVRAKEDHADQKYIWQLINNGPFENYVENVKTGTSIPHISLGQVGAFEIVLPPLPEQRAIASILSALDDKIELNLQMNKTLEEMAMTLYKHWFVDFGPFKDGKFIDSELGLIPEGWEVSRLNHFCKNKQYGYTQSSSIEKVGPKFLRITDIQGGSVAWENVPYCVANEKDSAKYRIQKGDLFVARTGNSTGENFFTLDPPNAVFASYLIRFQFNSIEDATYVAKLFRSSQFFDFIEGAKGGSAQPGISAGTLGELKLILPPEDILSDFYKNVSDLNIKKETNLAENKTLINLRETLLPKLISGEVRVKDVEKTIAEVL